jgi:hypothetical protein
MTDMETHSGRTNVATMGAKIRKTQHAIRAVFSISPSLLTTYIEDNVHAKCGGFMGCLYWQYWQQCALFV